jgi:signal transduction histidine kinase/CheY-like chemotaxis protein
MSENFFQNYAVKEFLEKEFDPIALTDKNLKIIWFNKSFKSFCGKTRIKGQNLISLMGWKGRSELSGLTDKTKISFNEKLKGSRYELIKLKSKSKSDGYLLRIFPISDDETEEKSVSESSERNLEFQNELQNILILLAKESELKILTTEIISKAVSVSHSVFGIIVFHENSSISNIVIHDSMELLKANEDINQEIKSNFTFISKWLNKNKKSLEIYNYPGNLGYRLTEVFQCDSLIVTPCIFEDELLAALILGKKEGSFSLYEINNIELFALLLSFAISSVRTRKLNTALELRLLQAQKLETIGKLSSGMAHDFSNLLSSIFGSLNLLKKRVPQEEDIFRLLDNIENCSIRAKDLTKGLLSYGKPTPKRKELIKPNLLLSEISKVINQTFPASINFESQIDPELHEVLGNGTEIYQVMLNLCVNAKEAIEGIGKIRLSAQNILIDEKNAINYPLLNKGKYVRFTVQDSGGGIDEEHLQKIFDPYFSTKQKETGSGLGLYVTYGIIKAHQGHIEVSSKLNEGTTFDVFIPAYEMTKAVKGAVSEKIVLLADDEIMLRDLLAELLESNDYNVIRVSSGVEALKVLTEEIKVDLAIIDYNMPEMNGLECIQKIRELKLDMPIILSTGSMSVEEQVNPEEAGIDVVLSKPYEFETMLATIQKLI